MSRYIAIATIRIEHDYYNPSVNRFVSLQPTPETKELMKRRGVMFRAVSANEWLWIMLDDLPGFMDEDVLELSMIVKDPCFLQQIENKGYDLGSLYKFNIENRVVEVNANYVWKKETNGQKLKDEFCRITLKPVETAPEKLRMLRYPEFTIRFSSPAYYWEYLCVFRDENDMRGKELNLKSRENIMAFCPPEKYEKTTFGKNVWRIVSAERIRLKEHYDITIQLFIGTRLESRFISPPQIGKHQSESPYTVREVCVIREQ